MKHFKLSFLLFVLMSMISNKASALDYDFYEDNGEGVTIYYKLINGDTEVEVVCPEVSENYYHDVTNNSYNQEVIHIPEKVGIWMGNYVEYPVTSIAAGTFASCTELVELTIPESVTSIGDYAFYGCSELGEIDLPYGITRIGDNTFYGCASLTSIEIPNSVTTIGEYAFSGCSKLQTVSFSNILTSIGWEAFGNCFELSSIELPNSLERIGGYAFDRCSKIQSVYIPSNVIEIGLNPFLKCEGIQYVSVSPYNSQYDSNNINGIVETSTNKLIMAVRNATIPNRIKIIGQAAFQCHYEHPHASTRDVDCSIILPEGVEEIGNDALAAGLHVGTLRIPSTIKKIGSSPFIWSYVDVLDLADIKAWCEVEVTHTALVVDGDAIETLYHDGVEVKELVIPNGTTKVRDFCFQCVKGITSVIIPNSMTTIGRYAFSGCSSLSSIEIPNSVTSIGLDAFSGCTGLTSVTVEWETPITITSGVFSNCANATLYVPRGSKAAYEAADYWKDFKEIVEYDANVEITMGSSGITTYSSNYNLDFTSVSGLRAYIASGFSPSSGELTMLRIYKVPAGEGVLLKGEPGSYEVPGLKSDYIYANMLAGVPKATTVEPTDGEYTNFILANDEVKGIGFYPLASAGEIGPNKAYLQVLSSAFAAARSLRMVFDDEEEITGINALNDKGQMTNDKAVYDLQGRRVEKPTRGLYIKDGKKFIKK